MCDGRVPEGGGVGRRQDNLQQDLGGAASLHPGGAADGFRLDSHTDIDIESDTKKLERPEEGVVTVDALTPTTGLMMKAFCCLASSCILCTREWKV